MKELGEDLEHAEFNLVPKELTMSNDAFDAMGLFDTLKDVFKIGSKVIINWHYEKGSDKMAGLGED